jgi:hypothetical protein
MEHIRNTSIALLFVVPFYLVRIFVATFHTCFTLLFVITGVGTRIGQQLEQVLWIFIQYCYLLLNCVPHIYICSLCAFQDPRKYFRSVQKKILAILVPRPHRYHEPATSCTVYCFALVRTL